MEDYVLVAALLFGVFKTVDVIVAADQSPCAVVRVEEEVGEVGHHELEVVLLELGAELVEEARKNFCDVFGV